ncbi:MAG: hypothetical protein NDJ89_10260 [Oligoflexia bacterium]|nr:hypothetical protein [Oligoflexia bacterium]
MRAATLALIVSLKDDSPSLLETLSDDREIALFETAWNSGESDPLQVIYESRSRQEKEESEFADYVEDLLSKPFLRPEIQEHGVQWLKSKIRIEQYQKSEVQAAKVIADYAFQVFSQEQDKTDFFLAGPTAKVRIRVFVVGQARGLDKAA